MRNRALHMLLAEKIPRAQNHRSRIRNKPACVRPIAWCADDVGWWKVTFGESEVFEKEDYQGACVIHYINNRRQILSQ
jgi:hypothetical protein